VRLPGLIELAAGIEIASLYPAVIVKQGAELNAQYILRTFSLNRVRNSTPRLDKRPAVRKCGSGFVPLSSVRCNDDRYEKAVGFYRSISLQTARKDVWHSEVRREIACE
jgi:hypothetical protein